MLLLFATYLSYNIQPTLLLREFRFHKRQGKTILRRISVKISIVHFVRRRPLLTLSFMFIFISQNLLNSPPQNYTHVDFCFQKQIKWQI